MYKVKNNTSDEKQVENSSPEADNKSKSPKKESKQVENTKEYNEEYDAEYDAEEPESEILRRKNSEEENSELLR